MWVKRMTRNTQSSPIQTILSATGRHQSTSVITYRINPETGIRGLPPPVRNLPDDSRVRNHLVPKITYLIYLYQIIMLSAKPDIKFFLQKLCIMTCFD